MPKCVRCGKKGIFLKVNYSGHCVNCENELAQQEKNRAQQEEKAYNLIHEANDLIRTIGDIHSPKDLERLITEYDKITDILQEVATIQKNTIFINKLDGDVQSIHDGFVKEKQWHIRDAIEGVYNEIIKNSKGVYKNYISETERWCHETIEVLYMNRTEFDEETNAYVDDVIRKLVFKFNISSSYTRETTQGIYNIAALEGHEFENWCADLLRGNGFTAVNVTKGSGDQGVDIIAEKDEIQYAIQCKRYSSDLGNTPIQEVYAGKTLYHCHVGVVMTNSHFTKSAKELAKATGVLLWDGDKIAKMQTAYLEKQRSR